LLSIALFIAMLRVIMLSVVMLGVVTLGVVTLSVIMLSVVAPGKETELTKYLSQKNFFSKFETSLFRFL
jgi:hypothetical protein